MGKYKLMNQEIEFSQEFETLNSLRREFLDLAKNAENEFVKVYENKFTSMEEFSKEGEAFGSDIIFENIHKAIEVLVDYGVYSVDDEAFIRKYYLKYCTWFEVFDGIDDKYQVTKKNKNQLEQYKVTRKEARLKWHGNEEAPRAEIVKNFQAGALNIASGIMYNVANLSTKFVNSIDPKGKTDLFNSKEILRTLAVDGIFISVFNIHFAVNDALRDNGITKIAKYNGKEDLEKAKALFNNLKKSLIPEEKNGAVIKEIIELNPYREDLYEFLVYKYGDENKEIENLSKLLGYNYITEYKYELLENCFKALELDDEEKTKRAKEKFARFAQDLGLDNYESAIEKYMDELDILLLEYDKQLRTVDYIEFPTREEAVLARQELEFINYVIFKITDEKEKSILDALNEIENNELKTSLKDKYIERLNIRLEKAIYTADEKYLNENFIVDKIKTEEEVDEELHRLTVLDLRTKTLVTKKEEELLNRKAEIIKGNDRAYVERIIRKYLFFKEEDVDAAINEIEAVYIKTKVVKDGAIEYLNKNKEALIKDCYKKLEKAKKYEERSREPKNSKNKKGLLGFMSKIKDNLSNSEEEERVAWEYITNNGMRSLDELDVELKDESKKQ